MKYLTWMLDDEYEIDPASPLGNIEILGETGSIKVVGTFLETFFESLIVGLGQLQEAPSVSVDVLDEPYMIEMKLQSHGGFQISYNGQVAEILDRKDFHSQLHSSVTKLVSVLDEQAASSGQAKLQIRTLREFVAA